jgi:hypothetical protein
VRRGAGLVSEQPEAVGLALHNYESAFEVLPPGAATKGSPTPDLSWMGHLLPYVEQEPLWAVTRAAYAEQLGDPFRNRPIPPGPPNPMKLGCRNYQSGGNRHFS